MKLIDNIILKFNVRRKIKDIATEKLTNSIHAMQVLEREYNDSASGLTDRACPLCAANMSGGCRECPWIVFTDETCSPFGRKYIQDNNFKVKYEEWKNVTNNFGVFTFLKTLPEWKSFRLNQIATWIKIYNKELKRRKKSLDFNV